MRGLLLAVLLAVITLGSAGYEVTAHDNEPDRGVGMSTAYRSALLLALDPSADVPASDSGYHDPCADGCSGAALLALVLTASAAVLLPPLVAARACLQFPPLGPQALVVPALRPPR